MRGIGGPRFASGDARSAATRSGIIGLGRSGNARLSAERARRHTLEAESKRAARIASADERRGLHERSAPRRAVVVHVRDWDAR
jgi:hypothetical protein